MMDILAIETSNKKIKNKKMSRDVLVLQVAKETAGPAVVLSFAIAGVQLIPTNAMPT